MNYSCCCCCCCDLRRCFPVLLHFVLPRSNLPSVQSFLAFRRLCCCNCLFLLFVSFTPVYLFTKTTGKSLTSSSLFDCSLFFLLLFVSLFICLFIYLLLMLLSSLFWLIWTKIFHKNSKWKPPWFSAILGVQRAYCWISAKFRIETRKFLRMERKCGNYSGLRLKISILQRSCELI